MAKTRQSALAAARVTKLREAMGILRTLGFAPRQSNEVAGYALLALLDLKPAQLWTQAAAPLRGIAPIIDFVGESYGVRYAPNTRETIRDEAVKYFVEAGMLIRNPDDPKDGVSSRAECARSRARLRPGGMEREIDGISGGARPDSPRARTQTDAHAHSCQSSVGKDCDHFAGRSESPHQDGC